MSRRSNEDKRKYNRANRNRARTEQLRHFVVGAFAEKPGPTTTAVLSEHVPGIPNKLRRALLPLLRYVRDMHASNRAAMVARHRREMAELREQVMPIIARVGQLIPGQRTRIPILTSEPIRYTDAAPEPFTSPTHKIREVDCSREYVVAYKIMPEMLRFALEDEGTHTRNLLAEISAVLARVIEIEMVRDVIYGLPPGSGENVGRGMPRTLSEVREEHPHDAYEFVMKTTRQASEGGDWRVAERFARFALELGHTEEVAAAAIIDAKGKIFTMPPPARHDNLIREMVRRGDRPPIIGEQGFMTSLGRFVDRVEARMIADRARQVRRPLRVAGRELYAEELW
jgi:hypothetical protein